MKRDPLADILSIPNKTTTWCKCDLSKMGITPMRIHFEDGPCGSTLMCEVTKHHYHCSKCGGVTQIG
jgi:hypothetical protein